VLIFFLTSCASFETGTRRINIVAQGTKERVQTVYWQDGRYEKTALREINRLFRDRTANKEYEIDPKLIDQIHALLSALALPEDTEVVLTSGYREPARNAELASRNKDVAQGSLHTKGKAADIKIAGVSPKAVAAVAKTMQGGGVAWYPKTGHIHVDTGGIRSWKSE
jgi:uncharacterized protein YcbK (DUF882 family)